MKTVKYIGQLLAALVYTPIYTFILYALIVFPIAWLASLSVIQIIIAVVLLGGAIEGLIFLVKLLGFIPFSWIFENNKCAIWLSAAICVILTISYIYNSWVELLEFGNKGIFAAGLITILMLQSVILTLLAMFAALSGQKK